jgi:hypothetical protein
MAITRTQLLKVTSTGKKTAVQSFENSLIVESSKSAASLDERRGGMHAAS